MDGWLVGLGFPYQKKVLIDRNRSVDNDLTHPRHRPLATSADLVELQASSDILVDRHPENGAMVFFVFFFLPRFYHVFFWDGKNGIPQMFLANVLKVTMFDVDDFCRFFHIFF